nr:60S acidic ribosomal protein P0-1-like [Tanacetum cinerariifolium]
MQLEERINISKEHLEYRMSIRCFNECVAWMLFLKMNSVQTIKNEACSDYVQWRACATRSIAQHAPATGNNAFVGLVPHLVGKVGLVMTSRDPEEMGKAIVGYNLRPLLCSSMDIGMYYIWQFVVVDHLCLVREVKEA